MPRSRLARVIDKAHKRKKQFIVHLHGVLIQRPWRWHFIIPRPIELSCSVIISLSYASTNVSILLDILLISSLVIALLLPALFELFHLFSNCQYLLARHQSREPKPPKSPNAFSNPKLDSPLTCTASNPSFQRSSRLGVYFQLLFVSVICLLL